MSENTLSVIKYISIVIIALASILLIFEYAQIFQIKQLESELNQKLVESTARYEELEKYKENITENKQELTEEYFRENMQLIKNDEIYIDFNLYA